MTSGKWVASSFHQLAATSSTEVASLSPKAACKVGATAGLALPSGVVRQVGSSHLVMPPTQSATLGYSLSLPEPISPAVKQKGWTSGC